MDLADLRQRLKQLRGEHSSKPITKMSEEEVKMEVTHHETACKATVDKEKRLANLAKAREARKAKKVEVVEKKEEVKPKKEKKEKIEKVEIEDKVEIKVPAMKGSKKVVAPSMPDKMEVVSAKKEKKEKAVVIPKEEFEKEHKELVEVLEKGTKKERKKEATKQKKELAMEEEITVVKPKK
jgi:hypothetical protein